MNQLVRIEDDASDIEMVELDATREPGIYTDISNEDYHSGPGISKSGLWTIYKQTPAHFKFPPEKEETAQAKAIKEFGTAAHTAILEPEQFENRVIRGPVDRRGDKWKDREEFARIEGKTLLVQKDYDKVLALRDTVHANAWINGIITSGKRLVEASAYFTDPVTGELCRVRPDLYREDLGLILDLKTTKNASPADFAKSVINYGYHAQEAFYSDALTLLGKPVNAFAFIAWEKESPYAFGVYELPPAIVEEGRAMMRKALDTYATCRAKDYWPGYTEGVQELRFDKRWQYAETEMPDDDDEAA